MTTKLNRHAIYLLLATFGVSSAGAFVALAAGEAFVTRMVRLVGWLQPGWLHVLGLALVMTVEIGLFAEWDEGTDNRGATLAKARAILHERSASHQPASVGPAAGFALLVAFPVASLALAVEEGLSRPPVIVATFLTSAVAAATYWRHGDGQSHAVSDTLGFMTGVALGPTTALLFFFA